MKRESEINSINAYLVLITSLLAICIVTLPERIPLKIAIASECERPWVECPLTDKISSPEKVFIQLILFFTFVETQNGL